MGISVFVIQRPINRNDIGFPLEPKHTGAILEYFHVVREENAGERIRAMNFDSDDREVLRTSLMELGRRITQDYELTDFECFRRIGEVPAGEACMLVRIAASHSNEAFRAMRDFLEEVKANNITAEPIRI